jgi:hypothetical protein
VTAITCQPLLVGRALHVSDIFDKIKTEFVKEKLTQQKTSLATDRLTACFTRVIENARLVSRVWKCIRYLVAEEGRLCMDIARSAWA